MFGWVLLECVWSCDVFGRTLLIAAETCKKCFHGKRREWMEKAKLIKIRKSGFQLGKVGSCLPINCCAGVQPSVFLQPLGRTEILM